MLCYYNNGTSMRRVSADHVATAGEILFPDDAPATEAQLAASFAGYETAVAPQKAAAALAAGCQIASTSNPTLNGIYACDPAAQQKIQATALYIQVNGKFPAGKTPMPWLDAVGSIHTFASTGEFLAFATAVGDYVTELEMVMLGQSTTLPTQPVTIA